MRTTTSVNIFASLIAIALYIVIARFGSYNVTIGGIGCAFFLVYFLMFTRHIGLEIAIMWFLLIYPIVIFFKSSLDLDYLTPSIVEFVQSFALWSFSVMIISLSVSSRRPVFPAASFYVAVIILLLMAFQTIGKQFFGVMDGYDITLFLLKIDATKSYLNLSSLENTRAIGLYYEPSMAGRIVTTLCFIDYAISKKMTRNIVAWSLCLFFTQSLGVIVLGAVLGIVLMARSAQSALILIGLGLLTTTISAPFLNARIARDTNSDRSSSYIRTTAPLTTVRWVLDNRLTGIPIGSAEALARQTGYFEATGESQITNGVYEVVTYFGITSFIIMILSLLYFIKQIIIGNRERAASVAYIILSTAISGTFLSIESSLLTAFFVGAMSYRTYTRKIDEDRTLERGTVESQLGRELINLR